MQTRGNAALQESVLTVRELAVLFHVSKPTIRTWVRQGLLPAIRFGSGRQGSPIRFDRRLIEEFITNRVKIQADR